MAQRSCGPSWTGAQHGTDSRVTGIAQDIALLTRAVLDTSGSPLLALAVPSHGWCGTLPLLMWDERLTPSPERTIRLCARPSKAPAFDALCAAADALFGQLCRMRLCDEEQRGLTVICDGTGVLLVGSAPSDDPFDNGWLIGASPRTLALLPLDQRGPWSLFDPYPVSVALH